MPILDTPTSTLFAFNVRINSHERLHRLLEILEYLGPGSRLSVRIRGEFSNDQSLEKFNSYRNWMVFSKSTYNEWKLDLLEQITKSNCKHIVLLQEDHLPTVPYEELIKILSQCSQQNVDFMPLSFFPQYLLFADTLKKGASIGFKDHDVYFWNLDRSFSKSIDTNLKNYPVNLVGYFSRDLLTKILCTERPLFKRYSIESPFDFEQKINETWYLPIKWAFPDNELFACVDDDHGISGYSLQSRVSNSIAKNRTINHHEDGLILGVFSNLLPRLKKKIVRIIPNFILVFPRNFRYTWISFRGIPKRKRLQRMLLLTSSKFDF